MPGSDQVVEKCLYVAFSQVLRVSLLMEEDELPAPVEVTGCCAGAVVASQTGKANLLK